MLVRIKKGASAGETKEGLSKLRKKRNEKLNKRSAINVRLYINEDGNMLLKARNDYETESVEDNST